MRCLYCGKELALLKRWTGGGEFCSDAHRQRYQEEYNQLALNRLLQAKPPTETQPAVPIKPAAPPKPLVSTEPAKEIPAYVAPRLAVPPPKPPERAPASSPIAVRVETPVVHAEPEAPIVLEKVAAPVLYEEPEPELPEPFVTPIVEEPVPAEMAGFLVEVPMPSPEAVAPISIPDLEFFQAVAAALPNHVFEPLNGRQDNFQLETAGMLTFQPSNRASNYIANGSRERRLEVRDFVRNPPIVEIDLSPAGETGLETSSEAMDILFFPQPPNGSPALWQQPPVGFSAPGTELGDLARLSFATTGFSDPADSNQQASTESANHTAVAVEEPPALTVHAEPKPIPVAPVEVAEVVPEPFVETAPEPVEQVVETVVTQAVEPSVQQPVAEQPVEPVVAQAPPLPEAVTKPLPLKLHVTGPGKAKTVQIFSSALSSVAVQVPRSTSLPLRPVMMFGPAPEKPVEEIAEKKTPERPQKVEPRKPPVAPIRPTNGKLRQPEVRTEVKAEVKTEVKADVKAEIKPPLKATQPEPVKQVAQPAAKSDIKEDKKQPEVRELKSKEEVKGSKQAEQFFPAPLAAPYSGSGDLGLPRLNLQSSQGFLGQLPVVAKIAIAIALVAMLGGLIAYSSKGGSATVTASGRAGTLVTGPALPVGDAGWITDWGSDPGVRRTRQISILRSSQTFTDYRIEMQGQIESKAIGWVFRAADSKNFYVAKLEIVKPGLEPTVALVRFAVVKGEEQAHAQLPLPMKVRRDTMYKIRFDAVGDHFTTYVQDEKVDEWTDSHVKTGGVGLYSERGEVATLKGGMSVLPLIVRK
jgi:hypothetical protein